MSCLYQIILSRMPSASFKIQKLIGREFEQAMIPVLEQMGFRVIDVDDWSYKLKKGRDCIVEIKGHRCSIEFKFDKMSEQTGNVVVDLDSLRKTDSAIWIYGLPKGNQIDVYAMRISDLGPFAKSYPVKKRVGEYKLEAAIIPKWQFVTLPFIKKFKTIEINV